MKGFIARTLILALVVLTPAGALLAHPTQESLGSLAASMWGGLRGFGMGAVRGSVSFYVLDPYIIVAGR